MYVRILYFDSAVHFSLPLGSVQR